MKWPNKSLIFNFMRTQTVSTGEKLYRHNIPQGMVMQKGKIMTQFLLSLWFYIPLEIYVALQLHYPTSLYYVPRKRRKESNLNFRVEIGYCVFQAYNYW